MKMRGQSIGPAARVLVLVGLGILAGPRPPAGADARDDLARELGRLAGTWAQVSHEENGVKNPTGIARKVTLTFNGSRYTAKGDGRGDDAGAVELDLSKDPKTIDLAATSGPGKGQRLVGIYKLEGDVLTLCIASEPGGERPTKFAAPRGAKQFLLTLKRRKR